MMSPQPKRYLGMEVGESTVVDACPNPASLGMLIIYICHEGINHQPQLVLTGLMNTSASLDR